MKKIAYNPDKLLSEDFRLGELIACEAAERLNIDNTPTSWEVVFHLRQLCREVLQPLRDHVGQPVTVLSGYRCPKLNEALHGLVASQHLLGCAADLYVPDVDTARQWYFWMVNHLDFDLLFVEHNRHGDRWLHVSYQADYHLNRHKSFFNYGKP